MIGSQNGLGAQTLNFKGDKVRISFSRNNIFATWDCGMSATNRLISKILKIVYTRFERKTSVT